MVSQLKANSKTQSELELCERVLGYQFKDPSLLKQALTHSSCAQTHIDSNERLEFLGDATLGFVVSTVLYQTFPTLTEGELSQIKSVIVSRETCMKLARSKGFEQFLITGKGLQHVTNALVANMMEALIGAIYLDGGLEKARLFIQDVFQSEFPTVAHVEPKSSDVQKIHSVSRNNWKSKLQEFTQSNPYNTIPTYSVIAEEGPPHARKFKVVVCVGEEQFPPAWGLTKKTAEQAAAQNALNELLTRQKNKTLSERSSE